MSKREIKLPLTPITEATFIRQGWQQHKVGDSMYEDDDSETDDTNGDVCYYTLALPKSRVDEYTPMLVSNSTDETGLLKDMGLPSNTFFVEILDSEGLGICVTEEELEILYEVLTGESIE